MKKLFLTDTEFAILEDLLMAVPDEVSDRLDCNEMSSLLAKMLRAHDDVILCVEFTFDSEKLTEYGHREDAVINAIKAAFAERNIRCRYEQPVLSFVGGEDERDWGNMWVIIRSLCKEDWFLDCATSCMWYNEGDSEDVLAYVKEKQQKIGDI